ncbi:protein roadkill-like [Schistocerca cancellata]|uniref:protein roadkill-like n=1 Tax=Schistocerca cancellata TaxID=274614 RepID=UPI0021186A01|nr:protein roadkill-like [Schistocerca cancellata]
MDVSLLSVDNIPPSPTPAAGEDTVCDLGSVRFETEKVACSWTVLNYKYWPQGVDEVKSPSFWHCNSSEWCMVLCKDVAKALYFCFQLLTSPKDATVRARLKASLVSSSGIEYEVYPAESVCLDAPKKSKWKCLYGSFRPEDGFDYMLKFVGEVTTSCVITEPYPIVALERPRRSITEDLAALLETGQLSDVKLWAGDAEFQAHRAVLAARSPVFAAMLRHDTQEARTGSVRINDVEADVLREVLRFVYTDSSPFLETMADRLLMAADKYDLPQLKELCEVELVKNLTVDNAAATAVIALSHSCNVLKRPVMSFVKRHLVPIMGSKGWATAIRDHAEAVVQISRLVMEEPL